MAPGFIAFADIGAASEVLDVGCGPGSLLFELARIPGLTGITGIDAAEIYIAAARATSQDPRITLRQGDACAMPFADAAFDAALSQLVLQFVPTPLQAVREMRRVVRPGGVVAAAVWNSGGGMPHQRMFWDIAAMLDPDAVIQRGKTYTRPMTRKGDLEDAFTGAGLENVTGSSVTIWMDFADFEDFWRPLADGEGTLGKYVTGLTEAACATFEHHVRTAYESGDRDGPRHFACTAFICRGIVPMA